MLLIQKFIKINDENYTLYKMIKINKLNELIKTLGLKSINDTIEYKTFNKNMLNLFKSDNWSNKIIQ